MSDQYVVPCEHPDNDPDDWFIEKDGKQYPDDEPVTDDERSELAAQFEPDDYDGIWGAIQSLEEERTKAALTRRRHARDKCHTDCYFRLQCLTIAVDQRPSHGTWGGYYPEQLRQVIALRDRKERQRESRQTDTEQAG